jgi:hypothetical protein
MNTANLQLEGLLLAVATVNNALVKKGLLTTEELDALLGGAEDTALRDRLGEVSLANAQAICFPIRLLRLATSASRSCGRSGKVARVANSAIGSGEALTEVPLGDPGRPRPSGSSDFGKLTTWSVVFSRGTPSRPQV